MPTTIFLILAAACYARSSDRFYRQLVSHPVLGTYLSSAHGRGMPRRAKGVTLVMLWVSIGATAIWTTDTLWLRLLLLAIATGVTVHVVRIPVSVPVAPATDRVSERP
jgi:uncharacterized membrane protein YbaN (DUF454 family)